MLVMSCLMRQKDIDLFICTTVGSAPEPSYRGTFQFSRVPVGTWDKSAFWITNYRGFSQRALTMKSAPLAKVMSYPVSAALFCWDRFRDTGLRVHGAPSEIELCSGFDNRFDDFWEELKYQNDNTLLAVRTRDTLAWHFRYSLMRQNIWILTASKGSRLIAYAIFDRQDNLARGLKRVRLVDFQALNGSQEVLRSALYWMLRKCRQEGIHVLENTGWWLDRPGLPKLPAPYQRTLSSWIFYYRANDKELCEILRDPKVWAPSPRIIWQETRDPRRGKDAPDRARGSGRRPLRTTTKSLRFKFEMASLQGPTKIGSRFGEAIPSTNRVAVNGRSAGYWKQKAAK
jgi:hypothetical protein